ncbi:NAD(+) diphosphatase [Exilibacterium tricleocarpae]|uniref:NAD-capped RNA hydrolase NudC n=1 Tax=Exilibacterium tricleocarpae TaxID=2591008 RepID=A0A545TVR0_9GAMM|nr:NAD(+) diphosphatase [Exilibacterium tricleocarpae]TQV81294.1 NAD(+) diphosphatase [Exilibacterium tricleocarpae]
MIDFVPASNPQPPSAGACFIVMAGGRLLSRRGKTWVPFSHGEYTALQLSVVSQHFLGLLDGQPCHVLEARPREYPDSELEWFGLRSFLGRVDDALFEVLGRAQQVLNWHNDHRFCGRCGGATESHDAERAKLCRVCDLQFYPRLAPCVIAIITRGDECLLARNSRFPAGYYSVLAGFIEAGESAEQALFREVKEEVGIDIRNPRYFRSQPWPFPGQLMLGFHAQYAGGEIEVDDEEIEEAHWFRFDRLPSVPPASTLSGQLIQDFVAQAKQRK